MTAAEQGHVIDMQEVWARDIAEKQRQFAAMQRKVELRTMELDRIGSEISYLTCHVTALFGYHMGLALALALNPNLTGQENDS